MDRSAVVERLFRPLAGQRAGEPVPVRGQDNAPLEAHLRPTPSRRSTATPLAWRVPDGETLITAPDGPLSNDQPDDALISLQHEASTLLRRPVEPEPGSPALRQRPQPSDPPLAQSPVEQRERTRPPEHEAEGGTPRDHQFPPVTSDSAVRLDRREEGTRAQPPLPPTPENEPSPNTSRALRERSEGPSQPVEPTLRPEPVRPATIPSVPEPQQLLHADDPAPPQVPINEAPPTPRIVELTSRQESDMRRAGPAEDRQPATVEIRPAHTEPISPPVSTVISEAPQEASETPTLEPQNRASPPADERQMPARVTLAVPATDRGAEPRAPQPASPQPRVTLSIGRIEIVTRRPSSPRRPTRPRGHQIDPGLAFFRQR